MKYQNRLNALFSEFTAMSQNGNVPNLEKTDYKKLIEHCFSEEKYEEGLEINEAAIQFFPFSPEFVVNKIELLLLIDQPYLALNLFESIDHLTSLSRKAQLLKAEALNASGNTSQALALLEAMDKEKKDDFSVYALQAKIMESLQQFDNLYQVNKNQIMASPPEQLASLLTKHLLFTELTENYMDAIEFYRKVIDKHPFSKEAWFNQGLAFKAVQTYDEAIDAFEFCIAIDTKNKYAYLECAECFELKGQPIQAVKYYHEFLAQEEEIDPEVLTKLGKCFLNAEDFAQAQQILIKAVLLKPLSAEGHFLLGRTFLDSNQAKKAIGSLSRAHELDPLNEFYILELAEAYLLVDNLDKAHFYFSEAIDTAPDIIHTWTAFISFLIQEDRVEELADTLEGVEAYFGVDDVIYLKVAALFALKKRKEALYYLGEALSEGMGNIETLFGILPDLAEDKEVISLQFQYK